MDAILNNIKKLYQEYTGISDCNIEIFQQSGSERRYFRLTANDTKPVIATYGANIKENESFIYFSRHFRSKNLPVPQVYQQATEGDIYLQEDLGNLSLLNVLEKEGYTTHVYSLFKKSLEKLAELQVQGHKELDYNKCLTNKIFGKEAIMADLLYFKYYFLDALRRPYDKQKLLNDFEALSNYLSHTEYQYFLFRDFQSRNIIVNTDEVFFIDYQGGMQGAPQYDVASMLWQARAALPAEWKASLLEDYLNAFEKQINNQVDRDLFKAQYNGYVLIRLLQVMGAYGFRGLFERKAQFLTSIPLGLSNLKAFLEQHSMGIIVPEFMKALKICISNEVIDEFTPLQANENTPLTVNIYSFSYKKQLPEDKTENGGGFMFDCRGILNPGRIESMKQLTGRDKAVKDYLEQQTRMPEFLNSAFDIVDITVEDYIRRDFSNLQVAFGCTGGQHRSVYAADALARHLRNKFKVKVNVNHLVQDAKNWINT